MLVKTKAILLHHLRYSDNSLIAHFYTQEYGRLSVMVKGLSSRKGSPKFTHFRPLNIFNLELYHSDRKEIHNIKEMSLAWVPKNMTGDINRSTIALFISELLYNIIREEDVNHMLYGFLESSVMELDSIDEGVSNFHLWFLVAFMAYAGIGPTATTLEECYFDMISGQFTLLQPGHRDILAPESADLLNRLLRMPAGDLGKLHLAGEQRSDMLDKLVMYYKIHLPGIKQIRSLQIMKEVFR